MNLDEALEEARQRVADGEASWYWHEMTAALLAELDRRGDIEKRAREAAVAGDPAVDRDALTCQTTARYILGEPMDGVRCDFCPRPGRIAHCRCENGHRVGVRVCAEKHEQDLGTIEIACRVCYPVAVVALHEILGDALTEPERVQLELHRERMASLRRAHRAVGGAVHHVDGDVTNNDLANIVLVDPADRFNAES